MSIDTGTVLRIVAIMAFTDGEIAMNVFNAVIAGGGGPWDEADVVTEAKAWLNTMYGNLTASIADTLDGSELKVYEFDPGDVDWDEIGSDSWTWDPSSTGDPYARGVSHLINVRTTNPDVNGKKYIPGLQEGAITDGTFLPGVLGFLADFADDMTAPFTGGTTGATWTPGVWSQKGGTFYACNGNYTVPTEPAYQRRRRRGVGI